MHALLLVLAFVPIPDPASPRAEPDEKRLQGEWLIVALGDQSEEEIKNDVFVFLDNTATRVKADGQRFPTTMKLDAARKQIFLSEEGREYAGIYEFISATTLRLKFREGKEPPADFKPTGQKEHLVILKRK